MMWKLLFVVAMATGAMSELKIKDGITKQFMEILTLQCKKAGTDKSVDSIETAKNNFVTCVKTIIDPDTIKNEIEEAKPNGALDEVFQKYCAKSPQLKTCINNLTAEATPCLDLNLRGQVSAADNVTDQLINFVCHKDGDRIALFIAEAGPECFQEQATGIRECITKLKESLPDFEVAKALTLNEQCAKYDELSACIVKKLEDCSAPTPSNMAEALFRFVHKNSPCRSFTKP